MRSLIDLQDPKSRIEVICDDCLHIPFALLAVDANARPSLTRGVLDFLELGKRPK